MLVLLGALAVFHSALAVGPVVDTRSGKVLGFEASSRDGRTFQAWMSIPYAQPPVGQLRLKAPQPVKTWKGMLNATEPMTPCVQVSMNGSKFVGQEDCLHLNVFRPKTNTSNLPVLVYVHGGAFQLGSAPGIEYADYIMDEDVILVAIHYRLNLFGFMTLGDTVLPGNFGLKDQVMALRWVKENVAAFGGNPDSITVFGESAGGASTHLLLKSPTTEGLVSRAVSDSGSINKLWSLKEAEGIRENTVGVAAALNCTSTVSDEILGCLQKLDVAKLMEVFRSSQNSPDDVTFGPVIEAEGSEQAFATENLALRPSTKPWIASVANGEYLLFLGMYDSMPADRFAKLTNNITEYLGNMLSPYVDPSKIPASVQAIESAYFPSKAPEDLKMELAKMNGDLQIYFPAVMNMFFHQGPKWFYFFEYPSRGQKVAPHASETVFYFKTDALDAAGYKESKSLIKRLVNFANYDDPTPEGSPVHWRQFCQPGFLRVTNHGDFMAEQATVDKLLEVAFLWDSILEGL